MDEATRSTDADATVVAHTRIGPVAWAICPLLGIALGWAVPRVAPWVQDLPLLPLDGPLELVQRIPEPHVTIGAMVLGAVAGLLLASMVAADLVTVTVADERARIVRGAHAHDVLRSAVGAVYMDGKRLVVLDNRGAEMLRESTDLPADRLRAAFTAHGFPWSTGDPFAEIYRPWIDGDPDLPRGADPLLRQRAMALREGKADRADEIRADLVRVGVVVRDRDRAQTWRRVDAA
jgi:hypothetical protein